MAWFDTFAKDYDEWYSSKLGFFVDTVEKQLIEELAEPKKEQQVLDIGAGTGNYSLWLARKGLNVTAIDQSVEMMKYAKEKAENEGLTIKWMLEDAHILPFENEQFDLVISITAIEFMDQPQKVLMEAMRVLKPEGRLVIGLLTKDSSWGELYQKMVKENPDHLFAKAHLYTEEEIAQLLPYPYLLKKGLYIAPTEDFDVEQAKLAEEEMQKTQANRAGFFAVCWKKE